MNKISVIDFCHNHGLHTALSFEALLSEIVLLIRFMYRILKVERDTLNALLFHKQIARLVNNDGGYNTIGTTIRCKSMRIFFGKLPIVVPHQYL